MNTPSTPYFERREDWQPPQTSPESPFRRFIVRCLKCGSFELRLVTEFNDEVGELNLVLFCPNCRAREIVPVR